MRKQLAQIVRANRRAPPFALAARIARTYLRLWHNEGYWDFARNGEAFALEAFGQWLGARPARIWDVGAHHGEWAMEAHAAIPHAAVTSFEIVPQVFAHLAAHAAGQSWLTAEACGLSDAEGKVIVHVSEDVDTTNAINPQLGSPHFAGRVTQVECPITTGDLYLARTGGPPPAFLKIDTEGHEASVLRGCAGLLAHADAPVMIQFEYGETYIPAGATLYDIQHRLEAAGYAVGRLYPTHVDFKRYAYADDHFRLGNVIAVRDDALRKRLSG